MKNIVHVKTGKIKEVADHIANNVKLMRESGYILHEIPELPIMLSHGEKTDEGQSLPNEIQKLREPAHDEPPYKRPNKKSK